ncbi:hypothetical protein ADK60_06270 [Streptomyces sp. XY431]|uniref:hypothetical protein n=1 Tax=Streptomyces sp. XY431 TaxID=1415562 RepID=UPI0006AE55B8|nr:hypothetical protein [Streptomyces sp. XY431]KOV36805.1 hypothetical protein ADK60_06270 [Streptomyces sp. XY431]
MNDPDEDLPPFHGGGTQRTGYGVNVGHDVHGGIHFHPPAPAGHSSRAGSRTTSPIPAKHLASLRAALTSLMRTCARVAGVLSTVGPTGPEKENQ